MATNFEEMFWGKEVHQEPNDRLSIFRSLKHKFLAYLVLSRLPSLLTVAAFFLLGQWSFKQNFIFYPSVLMLLCLLCVQFVNGLTNTAFDKQLDIFSRKYTVWVFKYVSLKEMLLASVFFSIISLCVAWFLNYIIFLTTLVLVITTIVYVMPPLRLKTHPPFDVIINALIFGTFPFLLGWLISEGNLTMSTLIYGTIMGLAAATYYLLFSLQDIKTDQEFGIKTSCTKLGYSGTLDISVIIWVAITILSVMVSGLLSIVSISFIICMPLIFATNIIAKKFTKYDLVGKAVGFMLGITGMIWVIVIFLSFSLQTPSYVPITFFIISSIYFYFGLRIYVKIGRKLYLVSKTGNSN